MGFSSKGNCQRHEATVHKFMEEKIDPGRFELGCQAVDKVVAMTLEAAYSTTPSNRFSAEGRGLTFTELSQAREMIKKVGAEIFH